MKRLFIIIVMLSFAANEAMALEITSKVNDIASGWEPDIACVYLDSGEVVKLDLTSEKGKLELTLSLSAKAMGSDLSVYFQDTLSLSGGCGTGTTVMQHSIVKMR